MSAFACEPGRGSEQEVGWRWALEMSRWFDVTVITQLRNRAGIERGLAGVAGPVPRVEYVQLPDPLYRLKSRFDPLTWPYYVLWQRAMFREARRLHAECPFDLAHHVTFVSFRVPVPLKRLGLPVVFGPVGGADTAPFELLKRGFGLRIRIKEILRNLLTGVSAAVMRAFPPLAGCRGLCLAATPAMDRLFDWAGLPSEVFPAVGVDGGPARAAREPGPLRLLFVGRFHPLKGTHLLLEAFARAGLPGATLTLVGGGSEGRNLRRLAGRLGIAESLSWKDKIPRSELSEHYRRHDVLVAPSLYESGGLVALEAMAEGTPVIVLDVGGHSVSVAEGCGIKVPAGDSVDEVIDGLARAIQRYAEDPARIEEDGRRARERVTDAYEWSGKARRMKAIYDRLMGRAG